MIGFFKSGCDQLCCIEKFRSCKMKNDNVSVLVQLMLKHEVPTLYFLNILSLSEIVVCARWRNWGDWGDCNAVCRDGEEERKRTSTNPAPSKKQARCSGPRKETRPCNTGPFHGW